MNHLKMHIPLKEKKTKTSSFAVSKRNNRIGTAAKQRPKWMLRNCPLVFVLLGKGQGSKICRKNAFIFSES